VVRVTSGGQGRNFVVLLDGRVVNIEDGRDDDDDDEPSKLTLDEASVVKSDDDEIASTVESNDDEEDSISVEELVDPGDDKLVICDDKVDVCSSICADCVEDDASPSAVLLLLPLLV